MPNLGFLITALKYCKINAYTIIHSFKKPAVLDKLAHAMLVARQNYQNMLIKYIATLREIHLLKKVCQNM